MKKILIVDDSDLIREFLYVKLTDLGFTVFQGSNGFDGFLKMRTETPDLVILDFYLSRTSSIEFLEKKNADPNLKNIPVIMASAKIEREQLLKVSQLGIKKFFNKPIKMDVLIKAISEILSIHIEVDTTPCIIDANYNDEIIFIEVARGLNKDKIELLKFRLQELIGLYKITQSKVIILMTGLELGPNDSIYLSFLLSTISENAKAGRRSIKLLTSSNYIIQYIATHEEFTHIGIVKNIEEAMDGLLGDKANQFLDKDSNTMSASFLEKNANEPESSVNLRFSTEVHTENFDLKQVADGVKLAIVDDDMVIRAIVAKTFSSVGIKIKQFVDGQSFIEDSEKESFDLIFLDLLMPKLDGFGVLAKLKETGQNLPIIVMSALSKKETVVKALAFGIKSYLIKPVKPEMILLKASEILRSNFS